jgi:hypothetical protein
VDVRILPDGPKALFNLAVPLLYVHKGERILIRPDLSSSPTEKEFVCSYVSTSTQTGFSFISVDNWAGSADSASIEIQVRV